MDFKTGREITLIGIRLFDDAYVAWVAAESDAEQALHAWFEGVGGHHRAAYQAYRAAADREEAAACDLRRLHELTSVCLDALVVNEELVPEQVPQQCRSDQSGS